MWSSGTDERDPEGSRLRTLQVDSCVPGGSQLGGRGSRTAMGGQRAGLRAWALSGQ